MLVSMPDLYIIKNLPRPEKSFPESIQYGLGLRKDHVSSVDRTAGRELQGLGVVEVVSKKLKQREQTGALAGRLALTCLLPPPVEHCVQ